MGQDLSGHAVAILRQPTLTQRATIMKTQAHRTRQAPSWRQKMLGLGALLACATPALAVPSGSDATLSTVEDTPVTLTLADFGFSDPNGYAFTTVYLTSQPVGGAVTLNGAPYPSGLGWPISVASINAGQVAWVPNAHVAGAAASTVTFQVQNSNGEIDPTPNTLTLNISPVNDAPTMQSEAIKNGNFAAGLTNWVVSGNTVNAYGGLAFNAGDSAPNGVATQSFITQAGSVCTARFNIVGGGNLSPQQRLRVSFVDTASQAVLATGDYGQGTTNTLTFTATSAGSTVEIRDISTNTVSTDIALNQISVICSEITDTAYEDHPFTWSNASGHQFQVLDVDGTTGIYTLAIGIDNGTLTLASTAGITFTAGANNSGAMTISGTQADINAALNGLTYHPTPNFHGISSLTFVLNDNGNTGAGGPLSYSKTQLVEVLPVNDAPAGADKTIAVTQNTSYTLSPADFGFTEPVDSPANALLSVTIASLPANGVLALNGVAVAAGQVVAAANIGQLTWTPAQDAVGAPLASFTFQVQDDGGTAHDGVDLDPTPNTITFNVAAAAATPVPTGGLPFLAALAALVSGLAAAAVRRSKAGA
jgi:hypothetical protein